MEASTEPSRCDCCAESNGKAAETIGRRKVLAFGARLGAIAALFSAVRGFVGGERASAATVKRTGLVKTSQVAIGKPHAFQDPYSGVPAYVLQSSKGHFIALSRVCPHMGCTVNFDTTKFLCPCHGSEFTTTGALERGPATRGLTSLPITVSNGEIYIES